MEYAYITKKVPRAVVPVIRELQAELTLSEGRRVTEAEVIATAVNSFAGRPVIMKKYSLRDLCGSIKGGSKTNATRDLDRVVYGGVR